MDRAQGLTGRHVGCAALLEAAGVAVELARAVAHQAVLIDERAWFAIHLPSLPQALAARADVAVVGMIVDEVGSFERSVASRRLVEHGDASGPQPRKCTRHDRLAVRLRDALLNFL